MQKEAISNNRLLLVKEVIRKIRLDELIVYFLTQQEIKRTSRISKKSSIFAAEFQNGVPLYYIMHQQYVP